MRHSITIAAILSGTDPVGPLPEASFHRWLETTLGCPRCDVSYALVVPWENAVDRHFEEESAGLVRMLKRAIHMGHSNGHRVTHFETSGVIVRSYAPEKPEPKK